MLSIWMNQPLDRDERMEYDRGIAGAVRFESSPRYCETGTERSGSVLHIEKSNEKNDAG